MAFGFLGDGFWPGGYFFVGFEYLSAGFLLLSEEGSGYRSAGLRPLSAFGGSGYRSAGLRPRSAFGGFGYLSAGLRPLSAFGGSGYLSAGFLLLSEEGFGYLSAGFGLLVAVVSSTL